MSLKGDSINSIIGEGSVFQGKFFVDGSIQVDGKFDGELSAKNQIIIGESGRVQVSTPIMCNKIIVAGTIVGDLQINETIHVLSNGKILGNLNTAYLQVEKGSLISGIITVKSDREDNIANFVAETFQQGPDLSILYPVVKEEPAETTSEEVKTENQEEIDKED